MKESKNLEFKRQITTTFLKTVSAYANYGTGTIEFGINDSGEIVGINDLNKACLQIENMINDSINPQCQFSIDINHTKRTIMLTVQKGRNTPYLYKKKAYKRNDTSTVAVDDLEYKRLILEGQNITYESLASLNQSLTFDCFEKTFKEVTGISVLNTDILKTLNLYDDLTGYNNAAEIISNQNSFPGIDVAKFGETINIILDRESYDNCSIIEGFNNSLKMFNRYYCYEEIIDAVRERKYRIPFVAFREALANGIVHRVWDTSSKIRILMFNDRIEIISPGGLPSGISKEEYLNGQVSQLRNPILSNIFFRLRIIEMFGTGILRIKDAYQNYQQKPSFEIYENSIKVILPTTDLLPSLTSDEQQIIIYLKNGRLSSSSEIATHLSCSKDKAIIILNRLSKNKLIEIVGNGRGTKYRIKK